MKYMCMAYEAEEKLNELSPEAWRSLRQETLDYVEELRRSGHLIAAHPLQSATRASTLRIRDDELLVLDGPFAEAKEHIGGYFLIEVADHDEAIRIAARWPSARLGSIEVRPVEEELRVERRY